MYLDYRARADGARWEQVAWWLGTLLALPIFLPIYLIAARPPGAVVRCPSCGRLTLSHRAGCRHCGNPIAFEPFPAMWGLAEVVGISVVFMLALPFVAAAIGLADSPSLAQLSAYAIAQNGLFIGLIAYVVRWRYRLAASDVGVRFERWPPWAALGLAAGALSIPLSTGAEDLAIVVIGAFIGRPNAEAMAAREHTRDVLTGILHGPLPTAQLVWILLLVCAVVPAGEELFFRGFVYGTLRRWGRVLATLLSAFFFAAVHQQVVHFLPIFLLGILLALLYERSGSLLPPVLVHGVNNVVAILSALYGWNI